MNTIAVSEARRHLGECVEKCKTEPIVIVKNGKREAILIPYQEDEYAALMLQHSPAFREAIAQGERDATSYSVDEAREALGL